MALTCKKVQALLQSDIISKIFEKIPKIIGQNQRLPPETISEIFKLYSNISMYEGITEKNFWSNIVDEFIIEYLHYEESNYQYWWKNQYNSESSINRETSHYSYVKRDENAANEIIISCLHILLTVNIKNHSRNLSFYQFQ